MRLQCGGQIAAGWAATVRCSSKLGRLRQAAPSSGSSPASAPPRPGCPVRSTDPRQSRHHFLWRFWPGAARLGRHGRARPLLGTAGCSSSGSRASPPPTRVDPQLRPDRRVRVGPRRLRHGPREALAAPVPGRAAPPLRAPQDDPLKAGLTDGTSRNREVGISTRRRSTSCSTAPTATATAGTSSRPSQKRARVKVIETVIARRSRPAWSDAGPPKPG